jgi:hypothetical protein
MSHHAHTALPVAQPSPSISEMHLIQTDDMLPKTLPVSSARPGFHRV